MIERCLKWWIWLLNRLVTFMCGKQSWQVWPSLPWVSNSVRGFGKGYRRGAVYQKCSEFIPDFTRLMSCEILRLHRTSVCLFIHPTHAPANGSLEGGGDFNKNITYHHNIFMAILMTLGPSTKNFVHILCGYTRSLCGFGHILCGYSINLCGSPSEWHQPIDIDLSGFCPYLVWLY